MGPSPMEVANAGSDYEVRVIRHGDGHIEIAVDLVLSATGRERFHFPRLTPGEAHALAEQLSAAATWLDTH